MGAEMKTTIKRLYTVLDISNTAFDTFKYFAVFFSGIWYTLGVVYWLSPGVFKQVTTAIDHGITADLHMRGVHLLLAFAPFLIIVGIDLIFLVLFVGCRWLARYAGLERINAHWEDITL